MPRWLLPAVVVGDIAVIGVLYAVLGWPALIVGLPLVICSIVVIVVLAVNGSGSPAPFLARAFVDAAGHPRAPAGPPGAGRHGDDDDWFLRTHHQPSWSDDGWNGHPGGSYPSHHDQHHRSDPGCSDTGSSWSSGSDSWSSGSDSWSSGSDSGSSSSSDSCSSSDSGSSSSSSSSSD